MPTVLLIDDDPASAEVVQRLAEDGHEVLVSPGGASASRALTEAQVDVLLLDAAVEAGQARPLLELAQTAAQPIPTLVLLSRATARDAEAALNRGASGVLDKPFTQDELRERIDRVLTGESFRGHLSGLSVLDMFQVFNLSRQSLVVCLGTRPEARVWFENGQVVHAERGEIEGEAVLDTLLELNTGTIRTLPFEPTRRSVERPFHNLLLDLLRTKDEKFQLLENTWTDPEDDFLGLRPDPKLDAAPAPPPPNAAPEEAVTALPQRRLDPICVALRAEVPGALAAALIELAGGQLIGLANSASFSPDFERFIALYTQALFRGPEITHIEETLSQQRGVRGGHGFLEEVVLTSKHTHHLTKVLANGEIALMVVTARRASVESTWVRIRGMLPIIERNLDR